MKRLFFGFEVIAPWKEKFPEGRLLDKEHRHMTLCFLGNVPFESIEPKLKGIPSLQLGMVGVFDEMLFLPVAALHAKTFGTHDPISDYQKKLASYLGMKDERPFLPHVTLARLPLDKKAWEEVFSPLPFMIPRLHLYESLGNLKYDPIWTMDFILPFEEFEHVADIAFHIRGKTFDELFIHAQLALAFKFPNLLHYLSRKSVGSIDEIVMAMGEIVTRADIAEGCPFKAVSYHGKMHKIEDGIMHWEMIVDV